MLFLVMYVAGWLLFSLFIIEEWILSDVVASFIIGLTWPVVVIRTVFNLMTR